MEISIREARDHEACGDGTYRNWYGGTARAFEGKNVTVVLRRTSRLFFSFLFFRYLDFFCAWLLNLFLLCLFNRCEFARVNFFDIVPEVFLLVSVIIICVLLGVTLPPR